MPHINLNKDDINVILSYLLNYDIANKKIIDKLKKSLNPIKVSSRKAKGRGLQKWICQKISEIINIPYDQQDDQCLIHSREMGQVGCDIILRGEAKEKFPFSIECKSSETFNIMNTIEQAKSNKSDDTEWLIVYKRKCLKKPVVIMEWDVFEDFVKSILKFKGEME